MKYRLYIKDEKLEVQARELPPLAIYADYFNLNINFRYDKSQVIVRKYNSMYYVYSIPSESLFVGRGIF